MRLRPWASAASLLGMQLTISAADLARRLCGFTHASGSITLTIEDERIRSQILALLLPGPQGAEEPDQNEARNPQSMTAAEVAAAMNSGELPGVTSPWQCGDILQGRYDRILVDPSLRVGVEVFPYDKAAGFAPQTWASSATFEDQEPFRRIGCVAPVVVLRARAGDEEAAAAIVRAAYPEGEPEPEPEPEPWQWQCGDILEGGRGRRPILVGRDGWWVEVWPYARDEDFEPWVWSDELAFEHFGPFRRIGRVDHLTVLQARGGDEEAAAAIVRAAYPEGDED